MQYGKIINIRDLYKGVSSLRKGNQPRIGMIKNERGDLVADLSKILHLRKSLLEKLVNIHTGE